MRLCGQLRFKAFYGSTWATVEELEELLSRHHTPFTCLHTCQPWGPDDEAALPARCQPGRACFEPSDREPSRRAES